MIGIKCMTRTPLLLEGFQSNFVALWISLIVQIKHGIGSSENRAYNSLFLVSLGMKKDRTKVFSLVNHLWMNLFLKLN